ncbi:hypothetical protein IAR55_000249 [Kwoniella newhampshirensis]|uniref:Mitochondrial zinc maintenance protein 1, mitochondrial n=1 Tax=Kwoniella newhampshirensis TaxID=1651941 RepID=A0AAW0Z6D2_9TREE
MSTCVTQSPKLTHPALRMGLATPPLTPTSPTSAGGHFPAPRAGADTANPGATLQGKKNSSLQPSTRVVKIVPKLIHPAPSYALLRATHVYALRYMIAKLYWEKANNQYHPYQDAEWNHDTIISDLENELKDVQAAQKGLDRFPSIAYAPISFPKMHGPRTREEEVELTKKGYEERRILDMKLDERFPFLRQLFVGPKTKQQAKNDRRVREQLQYGNQDDLEFLLPAANLEILEKRIANPPVPGYKAPPPRKTHEQIRMEKERAKIAAYLEANPPQGFVPRDEKDKQGNIRIPRIGPLTKEEYIQTLPRFGPLTREQALLPKQREQRHQILDWMRRPWSQWDEQAAALMDQLAKLARERLEEGKKAAKTLQKEKEGKMKGVKGQQKEGAKEDTDEGDKEQPSKVQDEGDKQDKADDWAKGKEH